MTMTAEVAAEERVLTISVTGAPDLPTYDGRRSIVPTTVEITYSWQSPDHRPDWYQPRIASAKVKGLRRLKSGGVGVAEETVDFYSTYGRERPDWLTTLVAQHLPARWDR